MTTSDLKQLETKLAFYRARAADLGVPVEVVEYLYELASDYRSTTAYRVARCGNDAELKAFGKTAKRASGRAIEERFYWDGVAYLIGFHWGN